MRLTVVFQSIVALGWCIAPLVFAVKPGTYRVLDGTVTYIAQTPLNEWNGKNRAVSGFVVVNPAGDLRGRFCLDLSSWDSGNPLRDAHTRRMFRVQQYPEACFFPQQLSLRAHRYRVWGRLSLNGLERPWFLSGLIEEDSEGVSLQLEGSVSLKEWGLQAPAFLGLQVRDKVVVLVSLTLKRSPP